MDRSANPPRWGENVLRLVLGPDEAETVFGDLLEQYRETISNTHRRWESERWLARQVAGFVWRALWIWPAMLALFLSGRSAFDTFAPPADGNFGPRAALTTYALAALFVVVGAWAARRTGRASSGVVAVLITHLMGSLINIAYELAFFAALIQPDPERMRQSQLAGGADELWLLPLMMVPAVMILGATGGFVGKFFRASRQRPALI